MAIWGRANDTHKCKNLSLYSRLPLLHSRKEIIILKRVHGYWFLFAGEILPGDMTDIRAWYLEIERSIKQSDLCEAGSGQMFSFIRFHFLTLSFWWVMYLKHFTQSLFVLNESLWLITCWYRNLKMKWWQLLLLISITHFEWTNSSA